MDLNKQFLLTNRASQAEGPAAVFVVAVGIQNKVDLNKLTNIEPHRLRVLLLLFLLLV